MNDKVDDIISTKLSSDSSAPVPTMTEAPKNTVDVYGFQKGNWGDLDVFQGDYINFGYWKNISFYEKLTAEDRVESSAALYRYIINTLNVTKNDVVLELGCGRGVGSLSALNDINATKVILTDISPAQIKRTKTNMGRWRNKQGKQRIHTEYMIRKVFLVTEEWELRKEAFKYDAQALGQEVENLSKEVLENSQETLETKNLKQRLKFLADEMEEQETITDNIKQEEVLAFKKNMELLQEKKAAEEKMLRKLDSLQISVASAEATGLKDHSVNKVFSVAMLQHIKDFTSLARELYRILTPEGKFSFCAHLATSTARYEKIMSENPIIDEGEVDVLIPITEVTRAFENKGFNVNCHSIGKFVFEGYEAWTTQIKTQASSSHNIYKSYKSGDIDYYACTLTKNRDIDNAGEMYSSENEF